MDASLILDVSAVLAICLGGYFGYRRGAISSIANLLGFVLSLVIAFYGYREVSKLVLTIWSLPSGIANILAFLALAFVVDGLVTWVIFWITLKWLHAGNMQIPKFVGILSGMLNNLLMVAYLASLVLALPLQHPLKTAVERSHVACPLAKLVDKVGSPSEKIAAPAITDLSQLFTIEPDSKDIVSLPFTVANPTVQPEAEDQMLALLNDERKSRGIPQLVLDDKLRQVARAHSLDMFQRGYFSHYTPDGLDPFDRMKAANITYLSAGENLALAPTVKMAHTGLMNSPGHKRNILDTSYHKIGIGAYKDSRYGIIFSQEFTD